MEIEIKVKGGRITGKTQTLKALLSVLTIAGWRLKEPIKDIYAANGKHESFVMTRDDDWLERMLQPGLV